jgi:hypothetical protein
MLRAGLAVAVRSMDEGLVRTASRLIGEVRTVGDVSTMDWRAPFDRRSRIYEPVARLARMLVDGTALTLDNQGAAARCFLIRTAPAFEQGIRELIRLHLTDRARVAPRGIVSSTGNVRFDPDIVIDLANAHTAVADVKYRDFGTDWDSGTRNQIVAFAAAARSDHAAVIGIERATTRIPRAFSLDALHVTPIAWKAWHDDPRSQLVADVESWVTSRDEQAPSSPTP